MYYKCNDKEFKTKWYFIDKNNFEQNTSLASRVVRNITFTVEVMM